MSSDSLMLEREFVVGPVCVTLWTRPAYVYGGHAHETRRISIDRAPNLGNAHSHRQDTFMPPDIPKIILALKKAHEYLELADRHRHAPRAAIQVPERVP